MKLGTWLCNDGRTRRPRRCTWMRAAAITAVAIASPAAVSGGRPYPSLPVSCPVPPAFPSRCSARSPDHSTYPGPARPGPYPPGSRPTQRPRRPASCPPDSPEASDSVSPPPRARSALQLALKLSNMWAVPGRSADFWLVFIGLSFRKHWLHRYNQLHHPCACGTNSRMCVRVCLLAVERSFEGAG